MKPKSDSKRGAGGSKRTLILTEAARTLNGHGISDTSLADIAKQVGLTKPALYYYFEDQQDLVFQCYRHTCEVMARRLNELSIGESNALDVIARFIDAILDPDEAELAVLSEVGYLDADKRNTIFGLYEGLVARLGAILQGGVDLRQVRGCDQRIVSMALLGLLSWIPLLRRWPTSGPFSQGDLADAMKSLVFDGVSAEGQTAFDYEPLALGPADIPPSHVFDSAVVAIAKQETLLAAASWLFNLKGVDATSLDEIAARMGVTKKVIYHNIGDKQALVIACSLRSMEFYISIAEHAREYPGTRLQAFGRLAHAIAEAKLREDIATLSLPGGYQFLPEETRDAVYGAADRLISVSYELVQAGQLEGSLRDLDIGALFAILPAVFEWIPKWLTAETADRRFHIARELSTLCRIGLRPR